jgi:hypothetical protein
MRRHLELRLGPRGDIETDYQESGTAVIKANLSPDEHIIVRGVLNGSLCGAILVHSMLSLRISSNRLLAYPTIQTLAKSQSMSSRMR